MDELKKAINEITQEEIIKVVISNKANKDVKYNKITFTAKENKGKQYYQIEKFTDKQVFHENIEVDILEEKLIDYLQENFKQLSAWSNIHIFDLKISKKGKVFLGKKKSDNTNVANKSHKDRKSVV